MILLQIVITIIMIISIISIIIYLAPCGRGAES